MLRHLRYIILLLIYSSAFDMTDANPSGDRDEPEEKPAPGAGIGLCDRFIIILNIVPRV